jgi:hypothetical protein
LSDNFLIQNGLKQEDALSPLLSNFALEYTIMKVQENQVRPGGTEIKWDVNVLGDYVNIIKKNTETLIDASKEVGLEVNTVS